MPTVIATLPSLRSMTCMEGDCTNLGVRLADGFYTCSDHSFQCPECNDTVCLTNKEGSVCYSCSGDEWKDETRTNTDIYVVVTEGYYGGGKDKIRVFFTNEEANDYKKKLGQTSGLDIDILELSLLQ